MMGFIIGDKLKNLKYPHTNKFNKDCFEFNIYTFSEKQNEGQLKKI